MMGNGRLGVKTQRDLGTASIVKGTTSGMEFASLDLVDKCTGGKCPISRVCSYPHTGPCQMQIEYLSVVTSKTLRCVRTECETDMLRVGVLMMPLYLHLVKMKMEEYGTEILGTETGRINPLVKETRETVKALDTMLSKLGSDGRKGAPGKKEGDHGDPSFYKSLFNEDKTVKPKKPEYSVKRAVKRIVKIKGEENGAD